MVVLVRVRDWVSSHRRVVASALAAAAVVTAGLVVVSTRGGGEGQLSLAAGGTSTTARDDTTSTTDLAGDETGDLSETTTSSIDAGASTTITTRRAASSTSTSTIAPPRVIADGTTRVGPDLAAGWYQQTGTGPCRWTVTVADGRSTDQLTEWMVNQALKLDEGSTIATTGCRFEATTVAIDNDGGANVAIAQPHGPAGVPSGSFVTGRDIRRGNWRVDGYDEHRSSNCPNGSCEGFCVVRVRTAGGLKLSEARQLSAADAANLRFSTVPPMVLEVHGESCPWWKVEPA